VYYISDTALNVIDVGYYSDWDHYISKEHAFLSSGWLHFAGIESVQPPEPNYDPTKCNDREECHLKHMKVSSFQNVSIFLSNNHKLSHNFSAKHILLFKWWWFFFNFSQWAVKICVGHSETASSVLDTSPDT